MIIISLKYVADISCSVHQLDAVRPCARFAIETLALAPREGTWFGHAAYPQVSACSPSMTLLLGATVSVQVGLDVVWKI